MAATSLCEVNLRSSRYLLWVLLAGLGVAFAALWLAAIPFFVKSLILVLLIARGLYYFRRYIALSHPQSILAVRLFEDRWQVRFKDGWVQAWPRGEVVVTPFLINFRLKIRGRRWPISLILMSDSACPRELHSLRIRLMLDARNCLNPDNDPESK